MKLYKLINYNLQRIRPVYILSFLIILFFGRKALPIDGRFIGGLDVQYQFWWNEIFIKEQFLSGSIPLWNPYYFSGHPFLANPSTFLFYPSQLLFIFLPLTWAFNLHILIHFFIAALGSYCFVNIITNSRFSGLVAGIAFALSGYFVERTFAGNITLVHAAALIPWVFFFIEHFFRHNSKKALLISGIILGLQILSGDPQLNFYTAFFLTVYFFFRCLVRKGFFLSRQMYRLGKNYLIIPLAAFGVSAIQIFPAYEFMTQSQRASNTYVYSTCMSFPLENFFTFLVAYPETGQINTNWEYGCYFGLLTIILSVFGLLFSKYWKYKICAIIICIIALTFMLGNNTPVYKFYFSYFPFISLFRGPARCIPVFNLFMAVLAGFGAKHLYESQFTKKKYFIVVLLFLFLFLSLFFGAVFFDISFFSKGFIHATILLAIVLILISCAFTKKNKNIVVILLVLILFVDLYLVRFTGMSKKQGNMILASQLQLGIDLPSSLIPQTIPVKPKEHYAYIFDQEPGLFRVNLPSFLSSHGMSSHFYCINGWTSMFINSYIEFVHNMAEVPMPPVQFRHTFNNQLFTPGKVFSSKILGVKYSVIMGKNGHKRFVKADKVLPRAVLVKNAVLLPELNEHLAYMKQARFDPEKTILLESLPEDIFAYKEFNYSASVPDKVSISKYHPNRIELCSFSSHFNYLLLSELFYPGWYAYVDGKQVNIIRADFLLRAIPIAPGHHNIVFVYRPWSFMIGAGISFSTIMLLGIFFFYSYRSKKKLVAL